MSNFWTNTHVLITGVSGFLGSRVLAALESRSPQRVSAPALVEYDLRDRFGFVARVDFREGLRRTIDWCEANRDLAVERSN